MTHKITLLPGDGIGPEVADAARQVIEAAGVSVEWDVISTPVEGGKRVGEFPRAQAVKSVRRNHVALKGPMATGVAQGPPSINVALRKELDLYANLRPVRNLNGVASRWTGVDLIIVRENTEDLYAGLEHTVVPGVVESLKIITERASTRIRSWDGTGHCRQGDRESDGDFDVRGNDAELFKRSGGVAQDLAGAR